ncbi:MAG TPA: glycosyltransferase family 2 protein [Kofleriaceae bacterium]|jgi:GT2 family glycosyltransferase
MNENTGRHTVIDSSRTVRQNRTDRVDVRTLRDGKTADRDHAEKITETSTVTAKPAPAAHRAQERTWLDAAAPSASLLSDAASAQDLESAILAAAVHASPPSTLDSSLAAPTEVREASERSVQSQTAHTASELDEIVLEALVGTMAPSAKIATAPTERRAPTAGTAPRVTIVMPSYNEENFIEACIASVQAQDYDRDAIEILVADGRSTDKTREILARLAKSDPRIRVIDNPARLQAAGLGLAVKEARGEIIVRMDVHAEYAPDYVRQCVATLEKTGAQNVGGAQRARAKSLFQKALCVALGSKLGTGGAGYRHEDAEGFVDTVFLGAFRRRVFETVGLWDPKAITNEDSELNQRILESGGTIYLSRDIVVHYYPRESLKALATQYFRYGRGRARTLLKLGKVPTVRPFLPFLAMTGLAATALLPPLWPLAPLAFGAYALATGAEAVRIGRGLGAKGVAAVWSIFPTLHASHAAGVWAGLVRYLREKDWMDAPETVAPVSMQTELPLGT